MFNMILSKRSFPRQRSSVVKVNFSLPQNHGLHVYTYKCILFKSITIQCTLLYAEVHHLTMALNKEQDIVHVDVANVRL